MRNLDTVGSKLFDKIRTRFENVSIGDEDAKQTSEPEKARFFNFDYISKSHNSSGGESGGRNFGNVTMSIADGDGVKVYFSKNITDKLDDREQDEWFLFLRDIRHFAKQNFMSFDARDINKSNLDLRDIKQQSKAGGKFDSSDVEGTSAVAESKMHGTRNMSFQQCGPVKIRVKHSTAVDEERRGSRTRNIESIFLDNHVGERRLLPFTNLHGARAMAQHCSQGGQIEDDIGQRICGMVTEMGAMRAFVREAKRRQFEDIETSNMASAAVKHYNDTKDSLRRLSSHRGYHSYKESFVPGGDYEDDSDIDALRERFVKKVYNAKFDEALPHVYRAYKQQQEAVQTNMGDQFESWISEDAFENDDEKMDALKEIMAAPLLTGEGASDRNGALAMSAIRSIFDDSTLEEELTTFAEKYPKSSAPKGVDARQTVLDWMRGNGMSYIADDIEEELTNGQQSQEPAEPEAPAPQPDPNAALADPNAPVDPNAAPIDPNAQPQIPTESTDALQLIRYLAGMTKR